MPDSVKTRMSPPRARKKEASRLRVGTVPEGVSTRSYWCADTALTVSQPTLRDGTRNIAIKLWLPTNSKPLPVRCPRSSSEIVMTCDTLATRPYRNIGRIGPDHRVRARTRGRRSPDWCPSSRWFRSSRRRRGCQRGRRRCQWACPYLPSRCVSVVRAPRLLNAALISKASNRRGRDPTQSLGLGLKVADPGLDIASQPADSALS